MQEHTARYREEYRAEHVPEGYSGRLHCSYEILHFAYHQREGSRILALPGVQHLRRLHLAHHDPAIMQHGNFNITWPICDLLFGTRVEQAPAPAKAERASESAAAIDSGGLDPDVR